MVPTLAMNIPARQGPRGCLRLEMLSLMRRQKQGSNSLGQEGPRYVGPGGCSWGSVVLEGSRGCGKVLVKAALCGLRWLQGWSRSWLCSARR